MAEIIRRLILSYDYLFDEIVDTKTKTLFLIAKPVQLAALIGLYLMFVLKWGPMWMKKRPAFKLEKIIMVYNATQVIACSYVFLMGLKLGWGWRFKWVCEPLDRTHSPEAMEVAHLVFFYFLLKIVDLMDTIFFVLRKKFNQVTFLHVYHHAGMVWLIWGAVTYYPGGHGTLIGVINSFVHVVMYSYYFLTVASPKLKQSSWWKKYITQLQILQFLLNVIHMSTVFFKPDCEYPRWISVVFLPQNIFMLILFLDFYIKVYGKKQKASVRVPVVDSRTNDDHKTNGALKDKHNSIFQTKIIRTKTSTEAICNTNSIVR